MMVLEQFTRVIGHITCGESVIPYEFTGDASLRKVTLLIAEHARLSMAGEEGIKAAIIAWFADPDLRLHWLEPGGVPLVEYVEITGSVIELGIRTCILTQDEIELSYHTPDPEI